MFIVLLCFYSDPLVFDNVTATLVLQQLSYDGYKDNHTVPHGYKFKVVLEQMLMLLILLLVRMTYTIQ